MEDILDRSGSYLRIFTNAVVCDKNLPKWKLQKKAIKDSSDFDEFKIDTDLDAISLDEFLNLDKRDFNIYLGKRIASDIQNNFKFSMTDFSTNVNDIPEESSFIRTVKRFYKKFVNSNEVLEEEVFEMNIFDFFNKVKLTAKESQSSYALRVEPYLIALKQAQLMGQQALIDNLTAEIFNNKYESILFSEGFHHKLTEEQIVQFVKKTEKGVRLSYISNFIRPVPEDVIKLKKKADDLLVFDNYCVLYYDPEAKSYKQTEEELKKERAKKADPILFGMISGSKNLYFVADWIDEYCDLTLEEFIKVSGIDKKKIEITEKIKL